MLPETEVRFSSELYAIEAVNDSARAFGDLAHFSIETAPSGADIIVRFSDVREDVVDALADEFCNHVLAGTIEHRRVAAV